MKIWLLVFGSMAWADAPPTSLSAPVAYELTSLRSESIAQYEVPGGGGLRQYLQFRDGEESHYIIYEESKQFPPLREVENLKQAMGNWGSACEVEMECKAKAFCTEDCHQMYYEMTNAPKEPAFAQRNNCVMKNFKCGKTVEARAPSSLPVSAAPAPADLPVAPLGDE